MREMYLALALVLAASVLVCSVNLAEAQQTVMRVAPQIIVVQPGQYFNVSVALLDVVDIYLLEFELHFDPMQVQCDSLEQGPFSSAFDNIFDVFELSVNNTEGTVYILMARIGLGDPPHSGSGILESMVFHCIGLGQSVLDLSDTILYNSSFETVYGDLGDFNHDGRVDMKDIAGVSKVYYTHLPYDPNADFDMNGVVDAWDMQVTHLNFGVFTPGEVRRPIDNAIAHSVIDGYVQQGTPVGGEWIPIDKLQLVTPWIGLISTVVAAVSFVFGKRIKKLQN